MKEQKHCSCSCKKRRLFGPRVWSIKWKMKCSFLCKVSVSILLVETLRLTSLVWHLSRFSGKPHSALEIFRSCLIKSGIYQPTRKGKILSLIPKCFPQQLMAVAGSEKDCVDLYMETSCLPGTYTRGVIATELQMSLHGTISAQHSNILSGIDNDSGKRHVETSSDSGRRTVSPHQGPEKSHRCRSQSDENKITSFHRYHSESVI